ncbi:FecR family protein [Chitinophaga arvensicola]|uniref:FecR protein n=1 Tax=Chitinophaga arvensicola TaxID=29529 RepID=A0A1I0S7Z5_9BACT|nr:FecR family protein [Chitinophaga arvensicola]SEW51787.1 FecR protein [Chitinophaga arvensicola]
MTKEEYLDLYERSLRGECSADELTRLQQYEDDFCFSDNSSDDDILKERIRQRIDTSIAREEKVKRLFPWKAAAAAAAVLLMAVSGFFYFNRGLRHSPVLAAKKPGTTQRQGIQPASNKAVLILADGTEIALNDRATGQLAAQGNTTINKSDSGQLSYQLATNAPTETTPLYNTLAIPRGGQYSLTLPDGSRIWLNAASRLRYPTRFTGKDRTVELEGEAYFEIAQNKQQPFIVKVKGMQVQVLGTHFNVMAYTDEATVNTTLLEGKVKLQNDRQEAVVLQPGQEGVFSGSKGFKVVKADIEQAMSWKNGYFIFNDEDLTSIMRKISRWYNVDIEYSSDNKKLSYAGSISRFTNVTEVLNMLALTGTVQFKINGEKIRVIN